VVLKVYAKLENGGCGCIKEKITNPTGNEYWGRIIVTMVLTFQKKLQSRTEDAICAEN
jgi:hypothetical protein